MKKIIFALGASLAIVSCGNETSTTAPAADTTQQTPAPSTDTAVVVVDFLTDTVALQQAQESLKALPKHAGKKLNVYKDVEFHKTGKVTATIQDPENAKSANQFEYNNGQWQQVAVVAIPVEEDLTVSLTPIEEINFVTVSAVVKAHKAKATIVEGASGELDKVKFVVTPHKIKEWETNDIEGTKSKFKIKFNKKGEVVEFKEKEKPTK